MTNDFTQKIESQIGGRELKAYSHTNLQKIVDPLDRILSSNTHKQSITEGDE
jgi:hypothetical protein